MSGVSVSIAKTDPDAQRTSLRARRITIIGAGIAGLTAATVLAQRGADVTVHERAVALENIGAGIQISPNAGRVMDALGLGDRLSDISTPIHAFELLNMQGSRLARMDVRRLRPNAQFRAVHRAALVQLLADAAKKAGASVHLNSAVIDAPDADLIVGADGLHSAQRAMLNGPETPFFTGHVAWRAIIPDPGGMPAAQVFTGPGRHLVSYPLGGGLRNIVAVEERVDWTAESWSATDDPDNMRAALKGFGGPVPGWLARVSSCGIWGLFRHQVAARWHDDRRVILGDAVHPTLPFLAQGACLAIEDSWTMAACLDADTEQARALARFQSLRAPRATKVVAAADANARNYHLKGPMRVAAHVALRAGGTVAPSMLFRQVAWIYDFDPTA